ncbi:MAG: GntP family permease [Oscillospiraceae bacterium]|nr:GntP family permease [Oscillospiraceae bacterium]
MLGIVLGLAVLMVLAFKGWSILWAAPIAAMIVALFNGVELLGAYTITYMTGLVGFVSSWFPMFMLGAIFGKLMEVTGMAKSVAVKLSGLIGKERALLAIVVSCAVLTYGGISLFVVVFAIYPIAINLFCEANLSRKIMPAAIALGSFTFTMTALPGSPQIQNLIPMPHFNTQATAAPVIGIVAATVMAVLGYLYLLYRQKQLRVAGEVFIEPEGTQTSLDNEKLPNALLSVLPLAVVIVTFNIFNFHIIVALVAANLLILAINYRKFRQFVKAINAGASDSLIAIMNTSAAVGFGAVVQSVPAFDDLAATLSGIPGSPLISVSVTVNVLAAATGSASGGLAIALTALGEQYYQLAMQTGISTEVFHRIVAIASGGLDLLPHNGAVITVLVVTGMTHKESYKDIFIAAIIVPLIALVAAIVLASFGVY